MDNRRKFTALVFLSLGRFLSLLLFFFWGVFFIEHVSEWFMSSSSFPPINVIIATVFHGVMLLGLLTVMKWFCVGATITILATIAFFAALGINQTQYYALVNILPIFFLAIPFFLNR